MKKQNQLNIDYFSRCIEVLEQAYKPIQQSDIKNIDYDIYRSACIKEFEIILEQCGSLLKKRLREFFTSKKQLDRLSFKDIFRYSAKHGLISLQSSENWLIFRDKRNNTAHHYGEHFAEEILELIPDFIIEAKKIEKLLKNNEK